MTGTFEIVLVRGGEGRVFELSSGNTRITIHIVEKAFVVELTNGDETISRTIVSDSMRLTIETDLVVLSNQRNENRIPFATVEVEDYADIAITPSVIEMNNDLFKETRTAIYPH